MAIDISHRRKDGVRTYTIKSKNNGGRHGIGITFIAALIIAVIAMLAGTLIPITSDLGTLLPLKAAFTIPLAAFLTARAYEYSGNKRVTGAVILLAAVLSHILDGFIFESSVLLHRSGLVFPLLMGYAALCVRDMRSIDRNVRMAVVFLLCLAAIFGEGGCLSAVWVYIFGTDLDRKTQLRYFVIAGIVSAVIGIVYSVVYTPYLPELAFHESLAVMVLPEVISGFGFLLSYPLISRYRESGEEVGLKPFCYLLCPLMTLVRYAVLFIMYMLVSR